MRSESTARRRALWPTIALVSAVALSSCGGSDEPTVEAAASPSTSAAPATTTPTTTVPPTTSSVDITTTSTTTPATTSPTTIATTTSTTVPVTWAPIAPPTDIYASEPVIEVGSIEIPKIGVDMTMYEGIRMGTLDYGPGHWPGTAMPGEAGNVVVGGHRTSKHRVFRNVDQLVPGDEIVFHDANGSHTYAVRKVEIVPPSAVWIIDPTPTPTATLFACHPPGSTRERIVVFADLVSG